MRGQLAGSASSFDLLRHLDALSCQVCVTAEQIIVAVIATNCVLHRLDDHEFVLVHVVVVVLGYLLAT